MKHLTKEEMIALIPLDENDQAEITRQAESFEAISPVFSRQKGYLANAQKRGLCQVTQVQFEGKAAYMAWWHISNDGGFWVNACQSYGLPGVSIDVAYVAAEMMARKVGARYIRMMTTRAGVIASAKACGYEVEGVIIVKPLS